jgi:hypothetical protein
VKDRTEAETVGDDPEEVRLLRESLHACQEELARIRQGQEGVLEEAARERALRVEVERQSDRLATTVEEWLRAFPEGDGAWIRVRRLLSRARLGTRQEWRAADLIAQSELFSTTWYLRRYPEVARKGLPAALHYVRYGAAEGKNPSEQFDTRRYLQAHPELAESGENPLVHHLRSGLRTDRLS